MMVGISLIGSARLKRIHILPQSIFTMMQQLALYGGGRRIAIFMRTGNKIAPT